MSEHTRHPAAVWIIVGASVFGAVVAIATRRFDYAKCDHTKLQQGMTQEEFLAVCGSPTRINDDDTVTVINGRASEKWAAQYVYSGNGVYVYVKDGKVNSWQYPR